MWLVATIKTLARVARCRPVARTDRTRGSPRTSRLARITILMVTCAALAGLIILTTAPAAGATILNGSCSGTVNGRPMSLITQAKPVVVREHTNVHVLGEARGQPSGVMVELSYFGFRFAQNGYPISSGRTFTAAVPIDEYAKYGVGSYEAFVVVYEGGIDGTISCRAVVYLKVKGNPLGTVAGAVATGLTIVGAGGVAASGVAAGRKPRLPEGWFAPPDLGESGVAVDELEAHSEKAKIADAAEWDTRQEKAEQLVDLLGKRACATLLLSAIFMTVGPPLGSSRPPRPRARWRPRLSIIGLASGLIGGIGVFVLLQQYAVIYPTRGAGIAALVGGLFVGILVPSLGRLRAVRYVNRQINAL